MFAEYFATRIGRGIDPAPLVHVEGRTHPVLEFTLNDLRHMNIKVSTCATPLYYHTPPPT